MKTKRKERENIRGKWRKIEIFDRIIEIKFYINKFKQSNTQNYFTPEEPMDIEKTNMSNIQKPGSNK